jgi:hypothetical protein
MVNSMSQSQLFRVGALPLVIVIGLLAQVAPAQARYEPLTREGIEAAVKRRAKLYVARRCRVPEIKGLWLWPGQQLRAVELVWVKKRYVDRGRVRVTLGKRRFAVSYTCLSVSPLAYSFQRGKVRALLDGIAREGPSLIERYVALHSRASRSKNRDERYQLRDRADRLNKHYERLSSLLHRWQRRSTAVKRRGWSAASGRILRSLVGNSLDSWVAKRGKRFLERFAGKLSPALRKRLAVVQASYGASWSYRSANSRRYNARAELGKKKKLARRYRSAGKQLRARLLSEDIGKLTQKIATEQRRMLQARMEARAKLLAIGIKAPR